ncbi:MAG: T9SS type A sorting domain-containing protein, partial [Bacteroidetes bacterium]|nr:T9SS type A sorting domain-containing protein [Bacteroidota bacterium]
SFTIVLQGENGQHVQVEVFDAIGQRVRVSMDEKIEPGESNTFEVNGAGLASGTYFIRFTGETFRETRTVTRVR